MEPQGIHQRAGGGQRFLPGLHIQLSLIHICLAAGGVKMICLNNPNNPTGALMDGETLGAIVDIARQAGAYLMCDEVYRHLTQADGWSESVVDLYEKGISCLLYTSRCV